jgi:hypothetical protein
MAELFDHDPEKTCTVQVFGAARRIEDEQHQPVPTGIIQVKERPGIGHVVEQKLHVRRGARVAPWRSPYASARPNLDVNSVGGYGHRFKWQDGGDMW